MCFQQGRLITQEPTRDRANLLVQLQPWPGPRVPTERLVPPPAGAKSTGLAFGYLGDIQLRFVFDQPGTGQPAAVRPEDLTRLDLTPGRAVAVAAANVKRDGGAPQIASLGGGVYSLRGAHHDYSPAYMLDREFWRGQLQKFPQGLLAALPRRGVLMFAPAGDPAVEAELVRQAGRMLAAADSGRISACLYHFDAGGWHLHSELPKPQPAVEPGANRTVAAAADAEGDIDLHKAARGQRMLIYSILGTFFINALDRGASPPPAVMLALWIALGIYSLRGVVRLSSGLGKSTGATIAFMVATFFPLVNLVTWIALSIQATRALRAAGWRVGLLGAREA